MLPNESSCVVVRLSEGESSQKELRFTKGRPVSPIAIGTSAPWRINGGSVAPAHVVIAWNGMALSVAALGGLTATLDGVALAARWTEVRFPSELRFGSACLRISRVSSSHAVAETPVANDTLVAPAPAPVSPSNGARHVGPAVTLIDESAANAAPRGSALDQARDDEITWIADEASSPETFPPPDGKPTLFLLPFPRARLLENADAAGPIGARVPMPAPVSPCALRTPISPVPALPPMPAFPLEPRAPLAPEIALANAREESGAVMKALASTAETPALTASTRPGETAKVLATRLGRTWKEASVPSKAIALLLGPALVCGVLMIRSSHASSGITDAPDAITASVPSARTSGVPAERGRKSMPAAPVARPDSTAAPSSAPASLLAVATGTTAASGASAIRDTRSAERRALDAAASGQDALAADEYEALARAQPDRPAFREAARVLRERAFARRDL